MDYLILDTETTGKYAESAEVVSVAIIDSSRRVLLDSLVRPEKATSWDEAEAIHKISPAMVANAPTLAQLTPLIALYLRGRNVMVYNLGYDSVILRDAWALGPPAKTVCSMLAFANWLGHWNSYRKNNTWFKLEIAARVAGHKWTGVAHGALADCFAALDVYEYVKRRIAETKS